MTGWRPLSTMGDAAQDSGEPRLRFSICFCVVSRSEAGSYSSGTWSDAVKQWSDGDTAEGTQGDRVSPFVNHTPATQGEKAQLTSCAHNLVNWRLPSPLKTTSNVDRGPLTTPKALPAYHATVAPPKQLSPPKLSPPKAVGMALPALGTQDH